jgi:transcriptional antiterminator Rof (Rho-off)
MISFVNCQDYFYLEYTNQHNFIKKTSLQKMTAPLLHVIQNYENNETVYLIDSNHLVFTLNLRTDEINKISHHNFTSKLFTNCIL